VNSNRNSSRLLKVPGKRYQLLLLLQYEEVKGVGVSISQMDKNNAKYSMYTVPILQLLPQYEKVKRVGVGVSRRDKCYDFWHYNNNQIYDKEVQIRGAKSSFFGIPIITNFMITTKFLWRQYQHGISSISYHYYYSRSALSLRGVIVICPNHPPT